eukprot:CAMPEP_0182870756 /NCGR_PEP_ID=MMETSP0034_2-20130328/10722_1 /TAXON_ID=156128 /ORGANISM="Nephroselmis pyriformis, Strain CCMP717" /LENGTH=78 /DNA_ID=CAMNT_0025003273 /DNA_START=143 /DNA_END=379 /DNA_ORIENTATION=+
MIKTSRAQGVWRASQCFANVWPREGRAVLWVPLSRPAHGDSPFMREVKAPKGQWQLRGGAGRSGPAPPPPGSMPTSVI